MNKNKILTTTIGSFPKPDYLPIMDWFDSARGEDGMNTVKTTIEYTKYHNKKTNLMSCCLNVQQMR
jgi:methionine synthase II (cobalamin-independent)